MNADELNPNGVPGGDDTGVTPDPASPAPEMPQGDDSVPAEGGENPVGM